MIEKPLHFGIRADQWGEQGLIIHPDGHVYLEDIDRKDGGGGTYNMGTWHEFSAKHLDSTEAVYQEVALYIKEHIAVG